MKNPHLLRRFLVLKFSRYLVPFLICGYWLFQATSCAPVFSDLQSARVVGKGNSELTGGFTTVSFTNEGDSEHIQNHFGLQFAYGVSDNAEMRFRFERVAVDTDGEESVGANVFGLGPKISMLKDRAAFYIPVGFAFGGDVDNISDTFEIHPTFLFTIPVIKNIELNPAAKILIPLGREDGDILVAINLGAGLSADPEKWVIRPEYGMLFNPGEEGHYSQFSIGFSVYP